MTNNLWIPHTGGECPVDPDTVVEVMYASGDKHVLTKSCEWDWRSGAALIVVYRIVGQPIHLEVPEEVIDAAMKVYYWMSEMEYAHGFGNIKLYGLIKAYNTKEGE